MYYGIFYKRLDQKRRHFITVFHQFLINTNLIGEFIVEAELFEVNIQLKCLQVLHNGDQIVKTVLQDNPYQTGKFVEVITGLPLFVLHDKVFNAVETIENKMRI